MFELPPKTKRMLEFFASVPYGTETTYAKILQDTDCDLMDGDRRYVYTVVARLERDHQRTLRNQRGRGYKVAEPGEFVDSARVGRVG